MRYRVVVLKPFLYAGRQVVRGEVLELTAVEALAYTHSQAVTWDVDQKLKPAPAPRQRQRRRVH